MTSVLDNKYFKHFVLFAGLTMLIALFGGLKYLKTRPEGIEFIIGGICMLLVVLFNDWVDKQ